MNKDWPGYVLSLLSPYADEERRRMAGWYFPTSMQVIGIGSEHLRRVTGMVKKEASKEGDESFISVCRELAMSGIFELQLVSFGMVNRNWNIIKRLGLTEILHLGSYMDNWVSTDSFGVQVAGPAWRLGGISDGDLLGWAVSADRWWRRIALVSTVALNLKSQKGEGDVERTVMICEMLVSDRDDMVVKALSWSLRELSKRFPSEVKQFLSLHDERLAGRVRREVMNKLVTGKKNP